MISKHLAHTAYVVAILLAVFPLLDAVLALHPIRPSDLDWRFAAVNVLGRALGGISLGALLAVSAALALRHQAVARGLSILLIMGAAALLSAMAAYTLDLLRVWGAAEISSAALGAPAAVAMGRFGIGVLACVGLALASWRGIGAHRRERVHETDEGAEQVAESITTV